MIEKDLESSAFRVVLHKDPESLGELDALQQYVYAASGQDVHLDFSAVEVFSSQMVIGLLLLDTLLKKSGHKLTLGSVGPNTRAAFEQLGVEHLFGLNRDRSPLAKPYWNME